jgi:hypothetical protein
MFREAIFSGLGSLLPVYQAAAAAGGSPVGSMPSMDVGGMITENGVLYGHKGETIMPAKVSQPYLGLPKTVTQHNHFEIDHPLEVADPVLFGNAVAFKLAHDPNSR